MQENNDNNDISKDKINSTSALINDIYNKNIEDNIKIGTLLKSIDSGGFALLNLIFSIILMIPLPPPIAIIAGLIVMFLSFQMIIGMKEVWLPKFITEKSIKRSTLSVIVEKSTIYLYKLERFTRRRFTFVSNPITERIIGAFIFFLAGITLTPIVFANTIPGLAIILISFGMINKDGLMVIIGFIVGIFSIFVVWLMISVGLNVVMRVLDKFFTLD